MQRTKFNLNLPDAINCSPVSEFTAVPNQLLRNAALSCKAKGLLAILLSNQKGWSTHLSVLDKINRDGLDGIRSGLKELEEHGYFMRVRYRNKQTKQWEGSFWMYTNCPFQFDPTIQLSLLEEKGFEPQPGFPRMGFPRMANPTLKRTISKKNNNNTSVDSQKNGYITPKRFEDFWQVYPKKANKGKTLSKWNQLCSKPPQQRPLWKDIRQAIRLQNKSEQWQNPKYIPHPTTWLNQSRWLDDPKLMKGSFEDPNKPATIMEGGVTFYKDNKDRYVSKQGQLLRI